jgi:DNA mismatch endonuclease, patch repair protein
LTKSLSRTSARTAASVKRAPQTRAHYDHSRPAIRRVKNQRTKAPQFRALTPSSPEASRSKRSNRSTGTTPEIVLRTALSRHGLRYRLHARDLAGRPDIVFRRARVVVFVDGDFWHGRGWKRRKAKLAAGSNASYWVKKIEANRRRDLMYNRLLRQAGWLILRFWETDVKNDPKTLAGAIARIVARQLKVNKPKSAATGVADK